MTTKDVRAILHTLPSLSQEDLQTVNARTRLLLSEFSEIPKDNRTPAPDDYLLEGIHAELRRRGLLGVDSYIPRQRIPPGYMKDSLEVRQNFARRMPQLVTTERFALGQLSAWALAQWLEWRRKQVSPRMLLVNVRSVPVALDRAFPGYLRAGLLPLCFKGELR